MSPATSSASGGWGAKALGFAIGRSQSIVKGAEEDIKGGLSRSLAMSLSTSGVAKDAFGRPEGGAGSMGASSVGAAGLTEKEEGELFEQWKEIDTEEKRKKFIKFIIEKVNINKVDESMLITAIMAPPAAMMAKKTGQIVPQLALLNAIPDVVFVPSATILALIAVKIIKLTFIRKTTSKDTVSYITEIEKEPQIPTTPKTEVEEPQTEQQPQTPTTPETEVEEPQTEQQPQAPTTSETKVEEHEIESEQESQTPTTPKIESIQEPLTITTFETKIEEESQTTATPETLKEEPQSGTEIKKELQSQTTNAPETSIQGPQIPVQQKPHSITGHVHKDNTTCFLCNEYHVY
ncbi:hypothetical protein LR48_Vigan03g029600 [Vigna angularis]|uniref:Uncharacterized protein n=1 Tax=Phaseolus angularis TaxID=3914 RepID=A0A0L9U2A1_PHAAN|nr:hypothetical protein LR48_Vigan03g029600 [Vigna angularis]